jgi:hypothetical protein
LGSFAPRIFSSIDSVVAHLWEKYGADFPTVNTGGMIPRAARAAEVRRVLSSVDALQKRLDDEAFILERKIWEEATQVYLHLRGLARQDQDLRMALVEAEDFFAEPTRKRVKNKRAMDKQREKEAAKEKPPKPDAPVAAPATAPIVSPAPLVPPVTPVVSTPIERAPGERPNGAPANGTYTNGIATPRPA